MPGGNGRDWPKYGDRPPPRHTQSLRNRRTLLDAACDRARYEADPLTAERLYTDPEREFLAAAEAYREQEHKRFLTATDYFRVLLGLGYMREDGGHGQAV